MRLASISHCLCLSLGDVWIRDYALSLSESRERADPSFRFVSVMLVNICVYRRSNLCLEERRVLASIGASSLTSTNTRELTSSAAAQSSPPLTDHVAAFCSNSYLHRLWSWLESSAENPIMRFAMTRYPSGLLAETQRVGFRRRICSETSYCTCQY